MNLARILQVALDRCQLERTQPVLVGFSGGPDSLCLLDTLARLGFPLVAAHLDHGLRAGSASEAEAARRLAERLGVPFRSARQDAREHAQRQRLSLEEAARELRYRFLFAEARRAAAQAVAVGHTADDQVETVLLHLLRGAGMNGLRGMPYRSILPDWDASIPLVRPLLDVTRAETLDCCRQRGLEPLFDPTNQDAAYTRNRVRHELLPALESFNPRVRQALLRAARLLAEDDDVLRAAALEAYAACQPRREPAAMKPAAMKPGVVTPEVGTPGAVGLRRSAFLELPPALRRRVLRLAAAEALPGGGPLRDLDLAAVERGLRWAAAPGSGQVDLARGLRLFVEGDLLWVAGRAEPDALAEWPRLPDPQAVLPLPAPGAVDLAGGWRITAAYQEPDGATPDSRWAAWLDAGALRGPLEVRAARPGDRFRPLGMDGRTVKLSDFWINARLPRRARAGWPLVTDGEQILWIPGFRLADPYRMQANTRRLLVLRAERDGAVPDS